MNHRNVCVCAVISFQYDIQYVIPTKCLAHFTGIWGPHRNLLWQVIKQTFTFYDGSLPEVFLMCFRHPFRHQHTSYVQLTAYVCMIYDSITLPFTTTYRKFNWLWIRSLKNMEMILLSLIYITARLISFNI